MNARSLVSKSNNLFWIMLATIVVTAFSLMLLVMAIQVISRYSLGVAVPWTDEVSRYLFLVEIFLGSVLALRYQEHIRITVVTDLLSPRAQHVIMSIGDIICIIVLLMLMSGAWQMMDRTAGVFASTFKMSFSYIYFMQFFSALLMILVMCGDLYRRLRSRGCNAHLNNETGSL